MGNKIQITIETTNIDELDIVINISKNICIKDNPVGPVNPNDTGYRCSFKKQS